MQIFNKILAALAGKVQDVPGMYSVPDDWQSYNGMSLVKYPEVEVARYMWDVWHDEELTTWNRSKLLNVLLEELHRLEERFRRYLGDAIDRAPGYAERAIALADRIRIDERFDDSWYQTTVLNFNYATPYEYGVSPHDNLVNTLNIHGQLDDEVVFGIDGSDCMDDVDVAPFTKTYRIMSMGMDGITDIVFPPYSLYGMETTEIKFFGHSLNKADYSYFQALFDAVHLYEGYASITFYYRPYGEGDKHTRDARCRHEAMSAVNRLLVSYGKTLDNKDHGKNLMHKLLLEGRLHLRRI